MSQIIHSEGNRQLHKFGGSSLATPHCYKKVINIISKYSNENDIIVVSASGNITDKLIQIIDAANKKNYKLSNCIIDTIYDYQYHLIKETVNFQNNHEILLQELTKDIEKIKNKIKYLGKNNNEIIACGEIWSAKLLSCLLNQYGMNSCWIDARKFLISKDIDDTRQPSINEKKSFSLLKRLIHKIASKRIVITGFICKNIKEDTVLLGRNGSDYSATQIGSLFKVSKITIWSDVAGIYTADPKIVKKAILIKYLSLLEANELARLFAQVLHNRTLQPVLKNQINLKFSSTFNPREGSTNIKKNFYLSDIKAKILTFHKNISLIKINILQSNLYKLDSFLCEINIFLKKNNVIPLATNFNKNTKTLKLCYTEELVDNVFDILKKYLHSEKIKLSKKNGFSLIAIIGENICKSTLYKDKFLFHINNLQLEFIFMPENKISIIAIIHGKVDTNLINKIHDKIFILKKKIGIILFGKGNIGSKWLELFHLQHKKLIKKHHCDVVLSGIVNSTKSFLDYKGINLNLINQNFIKQAKEKNHDQLLHWICNHPYNELIIIDITSSLKLAQQYLFFAQKKIHVISANKLAAGDFDTDQFNHIKSTFHNNQCYWLYNATVGAGLPINYTIRDLCASGDNILSISGIFSGTLSWLFLKFDGVVPFTKLLKHAWELGLTEPDPRIDLSGKDVTRKLIILIREAGYAINLEDIKVQSLVFKEQEKISLDIFFKENNKLNFYMEKKLKKAKKLGLILRYIAKFDVKTYTAKVGLELLHPDNSLSFLRPCDNIFSIQSKWYKENSLIIQGPGAGREITAGAIQSDINNLLMKLT